MELPLFAGFLFTTILTAIAFWLSIRLVARYRKEKIRSTILLACFALFMGSAYFIGSLLYFFSPSLRGIMVEVGTIFLALSALAMAFFIIEVSIENRKAKLTGWTLVLLASAVYIVIVLANPPIPPIIVGEDWTFPSIVFYSTLLAVAPLALLTSLLFFRCSFGVGAGELKKKGMCLAIGFLIEAIFMYTIDLSGLFSQQLWMWRMFESIGMLLILHGLGYK